MESKTVGWKIVPNTVTNRMVDFSLIHKLVPSRRFRRRCKVMNTVLKRRQGLKTYSQYVKIKTAVLRNLSDDEETDMSDGFTENDYNALYKSDLSLTNHKEMVPNQDDNYFSEEEFTFEESDTDYHEISKKRKEKSQKQIENIENQCLKISNLGWQDVIKDKSKSSLNNTKDSNISCPNLIESRRKSNREDIENNLQMVNNKHSSTTFKESSLNQDNEILQNDEPRTKEEVSQLNTEVTNSNEIMEDITKLPQITDNIEKPLEQINPVINNVNERLQSNENNSETLDNSEPQTTENVKLNLAPVVDDTHETQNISDSDANKKVFLDESHSSSSERNPNEQEMSMVKNKNNNKTLKIQASALGSTNQPKDSGIEEDTEEEILDNKFKNHKKERHKIHETQQDIQTMPSVSNQEDSPITQTDSSTLNDHLLLEVHDVSNNTDPKNTITTFDENIINTNNNQEKVQKHKLQPTVTCTEIVNRKYKIVSYDTTLLDNYANSELSSSDFNDSKKPLEMEETEQTIEDSISPLTKKRLQQLRRLNLTTESESGLSEDDNTSYNTKSIRDNLLRRSRESPDMSDSEDKNVKSKLSMLIPYDKKLPQNKNSKIGDYERRSTLQSINKKEKRMKKKKKKSKKSKNKESGESLGFTEFNNKYSSDKCITNCAVKDETDLNSVETYSQDGYPSHEASISEHSVIHDSSFQYNEMEEQFNDENQLVGNVKQVLNEKKTIMHDRPYNLQELINKDNLIHRPVKPSFTFKDIYEDDIFILDIPSMAFEKQLIGKKIILTEKKLKLGKQKYKVEYKDVGNISCVFGRKNPRKLYKTVNIKPTARIIARQKIIRTSLLKSKDRYLDESNETNCTEDDSRIEENVTSTNRHIEMEHEVPFKKRRYNIV